MSHNAESPAATASFSHGGAQSLPPRTIRILGVPLDLGASRRGVDMGPSAVRVAGLEARLEALGHQVTDGGNIRVEIAETQAAGKENAHYLKQIAQTCTRTAEAVVKTLVQRLRRMSSRVSELGALNVRCRVHAELLRLARQDRDDPRRAIIVTPPNQSELAARINTRRETVSREINAMERNGLIQRRRGAIVITDVLKLTAELQQASSG